MNIVFYSSFLISVIQNYRSCSQCTKHLWKGKKKKDGEEVVWINVTPWSSRQTAKNIFVSQKCQNFLRFCRNPLLCTVLLYVFFRVNFFFLFCYSHIKRLPLFRRLLTTDITPSGLLSLAAASALLNLMAGPPTRRRCRRHELTFKKKQKTHTF